MGKTLDKISKNASTIGSTLLSLVKAAILSRRVSPRGSSKRGKTLVILGNGPSLKEVLEKRPEWLGDADKLAVNFAANTPMFKELKPEYYILADPHFFRGEQKDPNVKRLWENILSADWPMTLFVPAKEKTGVSGRIKGRAPITIKTFNMTPVEGLKSVIYPLYDKGLGMPRPRNVMIPSVMAGIREGYRHILLAGADHSWLRTLFVDEENNVVSVQPHFYADNEKEKERVRGEYAGYHLHDILGSMTVAFRSYHQIADYARRRGVEIINVTPGSYIDAFPRMTESLH